MYPRESRAEADAVTRQVHPLEAANYYRIARKRGVKLRPRQRSWPRRRADRPTGYTGIRLHLSGGQPTGFNIIVCTSFDQGVHTPPELVVTYSVPAPPESSGGTFSPGFLATLPRSFPPAEPPPLPTVPTPPTINDPAAVVVTARDLDVERNALVTFVRLLGRLPTNSNDWTAVNHLAYGDRIERNLEAERAALVPFIRRYGRLPSDALDWLIVHVLGFLR